MYSRSVYITGQCIYYIDVYSVYVVDVATSCNDYFINMLTFANAEVLRTKLAWHDSLCVCTCMASPLPVYTPPDYSVCTI